MGWKFHPMWVPEWNSVGCIPLLHHSQLEKVEFLCHVELLCIADWYTYNSEISSLHDLINLPPEHNLPIPQISQKVHNNVYTAIRQTVVKLYPW